MNKTFFQQYGNLPKYHLNSYLIIACANGQLEQVKYLLSSQELKENADINCDNDGAFITLCMYGFIEHYHHILIKKLLQNENYKEPDYEGILQYIIYDKNIQLTEDIVNFLNNIKERNKDFFMKIEKMFSLRDLNQKLKKELSVKTENSKKIIKQ